MRRGQLGLVVRELETRLAGLESMYAGAPGNAVILQAVRERAARLETDRQWVAEQADSIAKTTQSELEKLAGVGGWSTDIDGRLDALTDRLNAFVARLDAAAEHVTERTARADHAPD